MIIPDRVIICGTTIDVKYEDYKYYENRILAGEYSNNEKLITICRGSKARENGKLKSKTYCVEELINTFYHELWHAICFMAGFEYDVEESSIHNELTATLFSNIAMVKNEDCNPLSVFDEFKTIVTDISEQDYRKLEYVVKNTKFDFDKLQPNDGVFIVTDEAGNSTIASLYDEPIEKDGEGSYYEMMSKRLDEIMDKDDEISADERIEMEIIAKSMEKYEKVAYPTGLTSEESQAEYRKDQMDDERLLTS